MSPSQPEQEQRQGGGGGRACRRSLGVPGGGYLWLAALFFCSVQLHSFMRSIRPLYDSMILTSNVEKSDRGGANAGDSPPSAAPPLSGVDGPHGPDRDSLTAKAKPPLAPAPISKTNVTSLSLATEMTDGRRQRALGRKSVSYRLVRSLPFLDVFNPYLRCRGIPEPETEIDVAGRRGRRRTWRQRQRRRLVGNTFLRSLGGVIEKKKPVRVPLYPHLLTDESPGVLDFNTEISTNVRILYMGDSVGIQMSQALEEACLGNDSPPGDRRHVVRYSWGKRPTGHEGVTLSHPVRGGGAAAGWRITGMFSRSKENVTRSMPNNPGGGWMRADADDLRRRVMRANASSTRDDPVAVDDRFDAVVHEFPAGWMPKWVENFTPEAIGEAVQLSHEVFGAETVVIQTVFVSNNVHNFTGEFVPVNRAIRDFANSYIPPADGSGVRRVLLLDVASLTLRLLEENAVTIGLVPRHANSTFDHDRLFQDRLACCSSHPIPIAMGCAEAARANDTGCVRNYISLDGMHWCMPTIAGRMNAGLACLLRCVYHDDGDGEEVDQDDGVLTNSSDDGGNNNGSEEGGGEERDSVKLCEARCNSQYMSLEPVVWGNGSGVLHNYA